jgi:hypothetical protein
MTDYVGSVLDDLVPRFDDERGDWQRVVADAGERARVRPRRRGMPRLTRRRLVLVALVVAALAAPLFATGSRDWWFLRFPESTFEPVTDVSVVRTGMWDGNPWELAAYRSADGLCFSLTPTSPGPSAGEGAAVACAPFVGVPPTAESKLSEAEPLSITFLTGFSIGFPAHIVGPVVDAADEVAIHLDDGTVLRTPTFDAPEELGPIRFYATQMPEWERVPGAGPPVSGIRKLVGLSSEGEVVACLVRGGATEDLSACA